MLKIGSKKINMFLISAILAVLKLTNAFVLTWNDVLLPIYILVGFIAFVFGLMLLGFGIALASGQRPRFVVNKAKPGAGKFTVEVSTKK